MTVIKQSAVEPKGAPSQNLSASVFLTTGGELEVVATTGNADVWRDIQDAFSVVETTPSQIRKQVAELLLDEDRVISVLPAHHWAHGSRRDVVSVCHFVVNRFNSWLKKSELDHLPWSSNSGLHLKGDAIKNARGLTEVGAIFSTDNRLSVSFDTNPSHACLEKLSAYLKTHPVFFNKVTPAFSIYVDSAGSFCIGCDNKKNKKEIRQFCGACATAVASFNRDCNERVKILVNVCIVKSHDGHVAVNRIEYSDDYSCFVAHELFFLKDQVCTEKNEMAWVYVDQVGRMYIHYSSINGPIEKLLNPQFTELQTSNAVSSAPTEPVLGQPSDASADNLPAEPDKMVGYFHVTKPLNSEDKLLASVAVTALGNFHVIPAVNANELAIKVANAFNVFKTLEIPSYTHILDLYVTPTDLIRVVPIPNRYASIVTKCKWIVDRFNTWPRSEQDIHAPNTSCAELSMKKSVVKNARMLQQLGFVYANEHGRIFCAFPYDLTPAMAQRYGQLNDFMLDTPIFTETFPAVKEIKFPVYIDGVSGDMYIGYVAARDSWRMRQACHKVVALFNGRQKSEKIKILLNVAKIKVVDNGDVLRVSRVPWSDDISQLVTELLHNLSHKPCKLEKDCTNEALVYVDHCGQVHVHCNPSIGSLADLFMPDNASPAVDQASDQSDNAFLAADQAYDKPDNASPAADQASDQSDNAFLAADQAYDKPDNALSTADNALDQPKPADAATTDNALDQPKPADAATTDNATASSDVNLGLGNKECTTNRLLAQVIVTTHGDYQVLPATGDDNVWVDIRDTFGIFKTTPLKSDTHVVDLYMKANIIDVVPVDPNQEKDQRDIVIACRWIVDRFNSWPKNIDDTTHHPRSSESSLRLNNDHVNARYLTKIGTMTALCRNLMFAPDSTPMPTLCQQIISLFKTFPIECTLPGAADVFIDQTSGDICIGCLPGTYRMESIRRACEKFVKLYNEAHGADRVKAKLLINVSNLVASGGKIEVRRVTYSDDCSCLIAEKQYELERKKIELSTSDLAWTYVDRIGRVYIYCNPPNGALEKLLQQHESKAGNQVGDATLPVKSLPEPKSTPTSDAPVSPKKITEKNKQDDIDLYFSKIRLGGSIDPANAASSDWVKLYSGNMTTVDWNDKLTEAVKTQPAHVVDQIFVRAGDHILMSMKDKIQLLVECMKRERADTARVLLDRFDMDADSMVQSGIKWGQWAHCKPHFCRELIERFDLPRSAVVSTFTELLEIKNMACLRWIIDRYNLSTHGCRASLETYRIIKDKLHQGPPDVFACYTEIFSGMVSQEFAPQFVNDKHDGNLLMDCLLSGKLTQFDFLIKHFQVNKGTLQNLFKCIVVNNPANHWDPNLLMHVLELTR
jgi:hypothetical protein